MIRAKGTLGGRVSFDGKTVDIRKRGLVAFASRSRGRSIPVGEIVRVHLRPATWFRGNGFIRFLEVGDVLSSKRGLNRQTVDSAGTDNSVIFTRWQQSAFERLKASIEEVHGPNWRP